MRRKRGESEKSSLKPTYGRGHKEPVGGSAGCATQIQGGTQEQVKMGLPSQVTEKRSKRRLALSVASSIVDSRNRWYTEPRRDCVPRHGLWPPVPSRVRGNA